MWLLRSILLLELGLNFVVLLLANHAAIWHGIFEDQSILLSAPWYSYAGIPVITSSIVGDRYQLRGLVITFNCICTVVGFYMLGFASQAAMRYVGTYLATGAYVSN